MNIPIQDSSFISLPEEIRFSIFDLIELESTNLSVACTSLWRDRCVLLQKNPFLTSRFLSWCLSNQPQQIEFSLKYFNKTNIPIRLEIPFQTKVNWIKKIEDTFPNIQTLVILPKSLESDTRIIEEHLIVPLSAMHISDVFVAVLGMSLLMDSLPSGLNDDDDKQILSSLNSNHLPLTTLEVHPKNTILDSIFEETKFPHGLKKFIISRKYHPTDCLETRNLKAHELSTVFQNCPELEELALSDYDEECLTIPFPKTLKHLSLGNCNYFGTSLNTENVMNICWQCPELRSLDIMRSIRWHPPLFPWQTPLPAGIYDPIESLKYLKQFTFSRKPSDELIEVLLKCCLTSIKIDCLEVPHFLMSDKITPLLSSIKKIIIDTENRNERYDELLAKLKEKYSHLKISLNHLSS